MFKNALVSVSDKTGLVEFLKPLVIKGLRIVSTGGTARYLGKNGIKVVSISEQTGFPEVMDGRVRTLHPKIHMAILSRLNHKEDQILLKEFGLEPFDLVVVNLYPFEEGLKKRQPLEEEIELIDIGGPSLLRAAAKNFDRVAVFSDPADYRLVEGQNDLTREARFLLATKVFFHTSFYDSMIANRWLMKMSETEREAMLPLSEWTFGGRLKTQLRYGENPLQKGFWYQSPGSNCGLNEAQFKQGKELSYNNILDLQTAVSTLQLFESPTAVGVKHGNPCSVASGNLISDAVQVMIKGDPVSIFGGIVAINGLVDGSTARILNEIFLECLFASDFTAEALEIFRSKKNLRVLCGKCEQSSQWEVRSLWGGYLVQTPDSINTLQENWKIIGDKPEGNVLKDILFAWKVASQLKSNAIAIVKSESTLGLGMGQVNRVDAVRQALLRAKTFHFGEKDMVMASDAFFPFPDSIEEAAKGGVKWVVQPGGSINDKDIVKRTIDLGINMVFTGQRHFKH